MVGTRSKVPDAAGASDDVQSMDEEEGDEEQSADLPQEHQHMRSSRSAGATSLELLPRPATAKGSSISSTSNGNSKSGGNAASYRGGGQQLDGFRRSSTRTSLERLPRPPPPAPVSPAKLSTGGQASSRPPPRRSARGLGNNSSKKQQQQQQQRARTSAELNALLGLDAARAGWPSRADSSSDDDENQEENGEEEGDEDEEEEEEDDEEEDEEDAEEGVEGDEEGESNQRWNDGSGTRSTRTRIASSSSARNGAPPSRRERTRSSRTATAAQPAAEAIAVTSCAGYGGGRQRFSSGTSGGAGGRVGAACDGSGVDGGGRRTSSRRAAAEAVRRMSNEERPTYGFRDRTTLKRTEFLTYPVESEEEEEEQEEEEEDVPQRKGTAGRGTGQQRRYKLRKREVTRRQVFNVTAEEPSVRRTTRKVMPYDMSSQRVPMRKRKRAGGGGGGGHGGRRHHSRQHSVRRSHFDSSSESSDGGGAAGFADHDRGFDRYQRKTHERELSSIQPINSFGPKPGGGDSGGGRGGQGSIVDKACARDLLRADVSPMEVDSSVTFESIGGGKKHVRMLKEMVMLPLVYPELFEGFGAQPPKGVLFFGPPGTGKTLTARALANACSKSGHRISFFMRKGADCLSKWVGEAERQLRLLFEQARRHQPSIIFFDEIDGLAPVRSVKQDQIHASVVSTLLALMDGLDSRGQVIVIGATNRPDSLDPALRRPGRFDRELVFPLPTMRARREILRVHTKDWNPPLSPDLEDELAEKTAGYCGADMKALCSEATLVAVRRRYPQIYESDEKLLLDNKAIKVTRSHFMGALRGITPSSQREGINPARPLPDYLSPLLSRIEANMLEALRIQFPHALKGNNLEGAASEADVAVGAESWSSDSGEDDDQSPDYHMVGTTRETDRSRSVRIGSTACAGLGAGSSGGLGGGGCGIDGGSAAGAATAAAAGRGGIGGMWVNRPRLALFGPPGCGQKQVAAAALHALDGVPVHSLALHSLHGDPSRTAEAALVSRFVEARRNVPSVLYLPDAHQWWDGDDLAVHPHLRTLLVNLLRDIPDTWPILVVSTWEESQREDIDIDEMIVDRGRSIGEGIARKGRSGSAGSKQLVNELLGGRSNDYRSLGHLPSNGVDKGWSGAIEMLPSSDYARERFVEEMFNALTGTIRKAFSGRRGEANGLGRRRSKRPPLPKLPLAPPPPVRPEEPVDESLEKEDEHHLRELRICLREVLSELRKDKRFAMFKQIGEYEGEFMDLNGIRDKLNAEEYMTLDDFEGDLKLMATEAKEVRDRLKANLKHLELVAAQANSLAPSTRSRSNSGAGVGESGAAAGGGGELENSARRAVAAAAMNVDRASVQVERASNALDLACFLRDAALSFLQNCVSRLGYDLEDKCKDIAARRKAAGRVRGGGRERGGNGGAADAAAGGSSGKGHGGATGADGKHGGGGGGREGSSGGRSSPNYTSESVIVDIYGGGWAQGGPAAARERKTRASRRTASDGRFVQLGDNGKLLLQGTEVEVQGAVQQRKRAVRQTDAQSAKRRLVPAEQADETQREKNADVEAPSTTAASVPSPLSASEGYTPPPPLAAGLGGQFVGNADADNGGDSVIDPAAADTQVNGHVESSVTDQRPMAVGVEYPLAVTDSVSLLLSSPGKDSSNHPLVENRGVAGGSAPETTAANGVAGHPKQLHDDATTPTPSLEQASPDDVGDISIVDSAATLVTPAVAAAATTDMVGRQEEQIAANETEAPLVGGKIAGAAFVEQSLPMESQPRAKPSLISGAFSAEKGTTEPSTRDDTDKVAPLSSAVAAFAAAATAAPVPTAIWIGRKGGFARGRTDVAMTALNGPAIDAPSSSGLAAVVTADSTASEAAPAPAVEEQSKSEGAREMARARAEEERMKTAGARAEQERARAEQEEQTKADTAAAVVEKREWEHARTRAAAAAAAARAKAEADAEERIKAEAKEQQAKRECAEACSRLMEARVRVRSRTSGWSVEQLLALRGGVLELAVGLCGRSLPGRAVSADEAVMVLLRQIDDRLA